MSAKTAVLCNPSESVAFYERRYAGGYMDTWPADMIEKVREVLRACALPAKGRALDFGCGTGVFTAVLADALPGWEIFGTDISTEAVKKASSRVAGARFFMLSDPRFDSLAADFAFTHHVLEHVPDLNVTRNDLMRYLGAT